MNLELFHNTRLNIRHTHQHTFYTPKSVKVFPLRRSRHTARATKSQSKGKASRNNGKIGQVVEEKNDDGQSKTLDAKAVRRREKAEGRSTYRPESYQELVSHAVESISYALEDGCLRMEVDFPTLAGDSEPCFTIIIFIPDHILSTPTIPCTWNAWTPPSLISIGPWLLTVKLEICAIKLSPS